MRRTWATGAAAVGATLLGGAIIYYLRERATEQPDFRTLRSEGGFQIREYPAMTVAETVVKGPRKDALNRGFGVLADYLFAKSRDGEKLAMTTPVLLDSGDPMGSDPPLFDDRVEGGWRTRFVMPGGRSKADLPTPPDGVELVELEPRRVGVVTFSGTAHDEVLEEQEDRLRGWLAREGEEAPGAAEYAFYNSPMIPPPLRRNEVLVPLG